MDLSSLYHRGLNFSLKKNLEDERHQWFLWLPVGVGLGILGYFSLSFEPTWRHSIGILLGFGVLGALDFFWQKHQIFLRLLMGIAFGFLLAQARTSFLSTPLIHYPVKAQEIEGTVVQVESPPGTLRIVLRDLTFSVSKFRQPLQKIRLTLRGRLRPMEPLFPGQRIRLRAVLLPPSEPVAPGSYDFRRRAFFEGISAVGFGTTRPQVLEQDPKIKGSLLKRAEAFIAKLRQKLTDSWRERLGGPEGEIAAALVTGDRVGIPKPIQQAFADTGIAHILAISGLHLTSVAGLAFFFLRGGFSLIPAVALRYPIKKWAAFLAILFTFGYLLVCQGSIPAQRAFWMTAFFLTGILVDRPVLTLRNVAFAALFVLLLYPESLLSPSFQLSFAAVIALVAAYEKASAWFLQNPEEYPWWGRRAFLYFAGIMLSTVIATFATTPFVVYTFQRFTLHGLTANLVAIPLTTFWIIPLLLLSLFLMPLGLEHLSLFLLKKGLCFLIYLACTIQNWPGSVLPIPAIDPVGLLLFALGGLWLCLWKQPWRWAGVLGLLAFPLSLFFKSPPDLFISQDGQVMGYRDEQGTPRVSSKRAGKFSRELWLRWLGSLQCELLKPEEGSAESLRRRYLLKNNYFLELEENAFVLKQGEEEVLREDRVRKQGAHFIWLQADGVRLKSVRETVGKRPWSHKIPYLWKKRKAFEKRY